MKSISIRGKGYVEVKERIKEFRKLYGTKYSIVNKIIEHEVNKYIVIKSEIMDDNGKVIATGHAMECYVDKVGSPNHLSYMENCETSAVGRAIGMLGIGIDDSIASYEEIKRVITPPNNYPKENLIIKFSEEDFEKFNYIKNELIRCADLTEQDVELLKNDKDCIAFLLEKMNIKKIAKAKVMEIGRDINAYVRVLETPEAEKGGRIVGKIVGFLREFELSLST